MLPTHMTQCVCPIENFESWTPANIAMKGYFEWLFELTFKLNFLEVLDTLTECLNLLERSDEYNQLLRSITPFRQHWLISIAFWWCQTSASFPWPPSPPPSKPWQNPKWLQSSPHPSMSSKVIFPCLWTAPNNPRPNTNWVTSIANIGTSLAPTLFPNIVIISHCLISSDFNPVLTVPVCTILICCFHIQLPPTLGYNPLVYKYPLACIVRHLVNWPKYMTYSIYF